MPRHAHPAWNGVSVKDLVTAEGTDGSSRYLPVRISRTCAIAGTEPLRVDEREVSVRGRGQTFVTPPRTHQIVSAGDVELSLLALVVPALA